jgi:hypothetical protein
MTLNGYADVFGYIGETIFYSVELWGNCTTLGKDCSKSSGALVPRKRRRILKPRFSNEKGRLLHYHKRP